MSAEDREGGEQEHQFTQADALRAVTRQEPSSLIEAPIEGSVPMVEVARLIKEHGAGIAANLWNAYEQRFEEAERDPARAEDREHQVKITEGSPYAPSPEKRKRYKLLDIPERTITVYLTPQERTEEPDYFEQTNPKIAFVYENENTTEGWKYKESVVHAVVQQGEQVAEVLQNADTINFQDERPSRWGAIQYYSRINMADMERVLGPYLPPPTQEHPNQLTGGN